MLDTFLSISNKFINLDVIRPIVDVFILSLVFYFIYRVFRTLESRFLFNMVVMVILTYVVAVFFRLDTVLWVFRSIFGWVIIGSLIIFQPELRTLVSRMRGIFDFTIKKKKDGFPDFVQISAALEFLTSVKRGALLVFPRTVNIESLISSKTEVDSSVQSRIIETIFSHNTPLHDGAIVIKNNRIQYAGCYLPMGKDIDIPLELGSRHRAAISLTKGSDAVVIIVSEENKAISVAVGTQLFYDIGGSKTCDYVSKLLQNEEIQVHWTKDGVQVRGQQ